MSRFNETVDFKGLSLINIGQSAIDSATRDAWAFTISALSHNAGATLAADGSSSIVGLSSTLARLIAQLHYQGIVKASIS